MYHNECILRLEASWKSHLPPFWTQVVLSSLCHVLCLCHSFKGWALPSSLLFHLHPSSWKETKIEAPTKWTWDGSWSEILPLSGSEKIVFTETGEENCLERPGPGMVLVVWPLSLETVQFLCGRLAVYHIGTTRIGQFPFFFALRWIFSKPYKSFSLVSVMGEIRARLVSILRAVQRRVKEEWSLSTNQNWSLRGWAQRVSLSRVTSNGGGGKDITTCKGPKPRTQGCLFWNVPKIGPQKTLWNSRGLFDGGGLTP